MEYSKRSERVWGHRHATGPVGVNKLFTPHPVTIMRARSGGSVAAPGEPVVIDPRQMNRSAGHLEFSNILGA